MAERPADFRDIRRRPVVIKTPEGSLTVAPERTDDNAFRAAPELATMPIPRKRNSLDGSKNHNNGTDLMHTSLLIEAEKSAREEAAAQNKEAPDDVVSRGKSSRSNASLRNNGIQDTVSDVVFSSHNLNPHVNATQDASVRPVIKEDGSVSYTRRPAAQGGGGSGRREIAPKTMIGALEKEVSALKLPITKDTEEQVNIRRKTRNLTPMSHEEQDRLLPDSTKYFTEDREKNLSEDPAERIRYMKHLYEVKHSLSEKDYYSFVLRRVKNMMVRGFHIDTIARIFNVSPHTAAYWMKLVKERLRHEIKNFDITENIAESVQFYQEMRYAATAILNKGRTSDRDKLHAIKVAIFAENAKVTFLDRLHAYDDYKIISKNDDVPHRQSTKQVLSYLKELVSPEEDMEFKRAMNEVDATELFSDNDDFNYLT